MSGFLHGKMGCKDGGKVKFGRIHIGEGLLEFRYRRSRRLSSVAEMATAATTPGRA